MRSIIRAIALAIALALLTANGAYGTATTFFGEDLNSTSSTRLATHPNSDAAQAAFLGSLSGVGVENFESIAGGTVLPVVVNFGSSTATLNGVGSISNLPTGTITGGYPISGNNFLYYSSSITPLSLTFNTAQAAFGFYGTDIGDIGGQLTLTLADGSNSVVPVNHSMNTIGSGVLYFGLISDQPFTAVTFGNTAAGADFFGFDDFTIGTQAQVNLPEPASLGLLSLGAVAICMRRSRRPA